TVVTQRRLEQLADLRRVPGERPGDKRGLGGERLQADVDGRQFVDACVLEHLPLVGGGGELALRQPVDAVVLDDVDHRDVAADQVLELAQADAPGVAIAADADRDQVPVNGRYAGGDRGHAPVQAVEAVRAAQEVGGRLAGAADTAQLDDPVWVDGQLIGDGNDLIGDRVVPAALAQR